jgi:hypothetical protein
MPFGGLAPLPSQTSAAARAVDAGDRIKTAAANKNKRRRRCGKSFLMAKSSDGGEILVRTYLLSFASFAGGDGHKYS